MPDRPDVPPDAMKDAVIAPDQPADFADTLSPELRAQEEYLRAQIAAGAPTAAQPPPELREGEDVCES
ncbi:hypothetical protein [Actinophytocola sediminis]